MPWTVAQTDQCPLAKPWGVMDDADGEAEGCFASEADAKAHMQELMDEEEIEPMDMARSAGAPHRLAFPLKGVTLRESKSGDGSLHLSGHAAVYDRMSLDLGGFREKITRGAFADVLDANPDVHLVIGHDMNRVLARTHSKTLELHEDPQGLRVWASLDPEDPDVRALIPKMRRGDVDQMSFAFSVDSGDDSWLIEGEGSDERVTRTVNRVGGLYDVSVVAQGAYPQTDANLRGLLDAAIQSGRLLREQAESATQEVEPVPPADDQSEPQGDLASDEQRTTAPVTPEAGDSSREAGEKKRVSHELADLKAHTRTETELSKRRLLAAR